MTRVEVVQSKTQSVIILLYSNIFLLFCHDRAFGVIHALLVKFSPAKSCLCNFFLTNSRPPLYPSPFPVAHYFMSLKIISFLCHIFLEQLLLLIWIFWLILIDQASESADLCLLSLDFIGLWLGTGVMRWWFTKLLCVFIIKWPATWNFAF